MPQLNPISQNVIAVELDFTETVRAINCVFPILQEDFFIIKTITQRLEIKSFVVHQQHFWRRT